MQGNRTVPTGIEERHRKGCGTADGTRCTCSPAYRAEVYSAREGRRIRKTFPTLAAAKVWRSDAQSQLRQGLLRTAPSVRFQDAIDQFLANVAIGVARTRSGDPYKPSTVRGYT